MAIFEISLLYFFFFISFYLVFFIPPISADNVVTCPKTSCLAGGLPVRFPFRLKNQSSSSSRCGYPGFSLSCDKHNQTILSLPYSGNFIIEMIEYEKQSVWINDPDRCLPKRFLNHEFNLSSSPFSAYNYHLENFTFLNCSSNETASLPFAPYGIDCLSSKDYTVYAIPTIYAHPYTPTIESPSPSPSSSSSACSVMTTALIPFPLRPESFHVLLDDDIQLTWEDPNCGECEARGGNCGYRVNESNNVGCSVSAKSSSGGLSRTAKYGIILGAAIPGILCIVAFGSFVSGKVREYRRRRHPNFPSSTMDLPHPVVVVMGLDGPTIESFPKTLLGESRRLPKPNDNTCPICLSEYQPKETLRTIPECNHYFHANCVDEWLKMNATCPLCRNSPEGSSAMTPSSSISSGTRSSSNISSSSLASS